MKVRIVGWYTGEKSEEEIANLQEWIEKHDGAVIVYPPSITADGKWIIATSDDNKFHQR